MSEIEESDHSKIKDRLITLSQKWHSITFAILYYVEVKSLALGHAQGEGITQGCEYQEVEIIGGHLGDLTTVVHSLAPNDSHPFHVQNIFTPSQGQ